MTLDDNRHSNAARIHPEDELFDLCKWMVQHRMADGKMPKGTRRVTMEVCGREHEHAVWRSKAHANGTFDVCQCGFTRDTTEAGPFQEIGPWQRS